MPTARKLPSGSWRCQVYSHTEEIKQPDGNIKKKRIYKSFTSDIQGAKGKRAAEAAAAAWAMDKEKKVDVCDMTVAEAIEKYIESKSHVLQESTLIGYDVIKRNYMKNISSKKLSDITRGFVQKWVNELSMTASLKTVKNAYGLFSAVMIMYADKRFKIQFPQKKQEEIYIPSDDDVKVLIQNSSGDLQTVIYLAAFGGLRRGEIRVLDSRRAVPGKLNPLRQTVVIEMCCYQIFYWNA